MKFKPGLPEWSKWCHWSDDGAPVKCTACVDAKVANPEGATILRQFDLAYSDGYALRGMYHEECASFLWGDDWKTRAKHDSSLLHNAPPRLP